MGFYTYILVISNILISVYCFNFDIHQIITKTNKNSTTLFGLSVSPHMIKSRPQAAKILVGAPIYYNSNTTGAIYQCPYSANSDDCEIVNIPKIKEYEWSAYKYKYDGQLLGLNVISATVFGGDLAFACAPGQMKYNDYGVYSFRGACAALENNLTSGYWMRWPSKITCKTTGSTAITAFCLRGVSMTTNKENELLIGAPFECLDHKHLSVGLSYLVREPQSELKIENTMSMRNYSKIDGSYLGWSTGMGRIYADASTSVVLGAPGIPQNINEIAQDELGMGFVQLYSVGPANEKSYNLRQRFIGKQFGSRYGHSVLVVDINDDKWDDLLVGAPYVRAADGFIGGGAVYVYLNMEGKRLQFNQTLQPTGESSQQCETLKCSRRLFGYALSDLDDVNLDGYKDVGISAPGEGNGVIYIFHGSADGLVSRPAQKITADSAKFLGTSLGHGLDLDNNGYPDLVAGAIGSASATVFRARPIIKIAVDIEFQPRRLSNLQKSETDCDAEHDFYCMAMKIKTNYTPARQTKGERKGSYVGSLTIVADVTSKAFRYLPRVTLLDGTVGRKTKLNLLNVKFPNGPAEERTVTVLFKRDHLAFMDKLNPIKFNVSWSLNIPSPPATPGSKLSSMDNFPMYDAATAFKIASLPWKTDCITKCKSALELSYKTSLTPDGKSAGNFIYLMGGDNFIWMNFTVRNHIGEAHRTLLTLQHNKTIIFNQAKTNCPFNCSSKESQVECAIANPLIRGTNVACNIYFTIGNLQPDKGILRFSSAVSTISEDRKQLPTQYNFTAKVQIRAMVTLTSNTDRSDIFYGNSSAIKGAAAVIHELNVGRHRIGIYFKLENRLSSLIPQSTITFLWPHEIFGNPKEEHGQYLLYLLTEPEISSNVHVNCSKAVLDKLVNPNKVRLIDMKKDKNAKYSSARYRRSVSEESFNLRDRNGQLQPCSDSIARCAVLKCKIGSFGKGTGAITFKFSARVWVYTLLENFRNRKFVDIIVKAKWNASDKYPIYQVNQTHPETKVAIRASNSGLKVTVKPKNFTWIIVGAAVAGVILLGCIIIILWKCNFFARTDIEKKRAELARQSRIQDYDYDED